MAITDKISEKENSIRIGIDKLKNALNTKRKAYNVNPSDWVYLASLCHTETKLNEILEYLDSAEAAKGK